MSGKIPNMNFGNYTAPKNHTITQAMLLQHNRKHAALVKRKAYLLAELQRLEYMLADSRYVNKNFKRLHAQQFIG